MTVWTQWPEPYMKRKGLKMNVTYNDGGRAAAGFAGNTGDCVVRSIAIVGELNYRDVYDHLSAALGTGKSPRNGIPKKVYKKYLDDRGWIWTPTMQIGSGCTVHLRADELPAGRVLVSTSRHLTAVIDGQIHDTHDPSRGGTRCVYGYYQPPTAKVAQDKLEATLAAQNPHPATLDEAGFPRFREFQMSKNCAGCRREYGAKETAEFFIKGTVLTFEGATSKRVPRSGNYCETHLDDLRDAGFEGKVTRLNRRPAVNKAPKLEWLPGESLSDHARRCFAAAREEN